MIQRLVFSYVFFLAVSSLVTAQEPYKCEDGKYGFAEEVADGMVPTIPCMYDTVVAFIEQGIGVVKLDSRFAFIDRSGKQIGDWYDWIDLLCFDDIYQTVPVRKDGKYNIVNEKAALVFDAWIDTAYFNDWYQEDYSFVPVKRFGKWNMASQKGKFLSKVWFDTIYFHRTYYDYERVMVGNDGKISILDSKGKTGKDWVDYIDYDQSQLFIVFEYPCIPVMVDGKWSLLLNGDKLIDGRFDELLHDYEYFFAKTENEWTCYGYNGKPDLISTFGDSFTYFSSLAKARKNKMWGYVDAEGKTIIDFQFEEAYNFLGFTTLVRKNGMYGFIDNAGKEVGGFVYEQIFGCGDNIIPAKKDGVFGFIDRRGKTLVDFQFQDAGCFSSGLAAVKKNDAYGYIDINGNVIIDYQYRSADKFDGNGFARISTMEGKHAFIDKEANVLGGHMFRYIGHFNAAGYAMVWTESGDKWIDTKGNLYDSDPNEK